ncbi:MAG: methyltransferase domain-containing protein [Spirochaetes bacterium]|nr:methyltransferase domain-containing protein [Spirochaetota bacterium]
MKNLLIPDLTKRATTPEIMDDLNCDEKQLINTVKQFVLINQLFTGSHRLLKKVIYKDMLKSGKKEFTLLDLGAGGCDIDIWFSHYTQKRGITLNITCLDYDSRIINYAKQQVKNHPRIQLKLMSAFEIDQLPDYDYIFANHFLHHFYDEDILNILQLINKKSQRIFIINDIKRNYLAYIGYSLYAGLFCHQSFAFYDGRLSIAKGFTKEELSEYIETINSRVKIHSAFPSRLVLLGDKVGNLTSPHVVYDN